MPPKVSIQIPTYNQQQYITQAIESALMQDYPNLEIVIADDCSTDDTESIVKKYNDSRIRYFKNETNIGRVPNYRKALYEYCTGEWVVNLDGDDYYTNPGFISRGMSLIEEFRAKGETIVFYQGLHIINDTSMGKELPREHTILRGGEKFRLVDNYYLDIYRKNKFFSHLTTLYNREVATRIGFYEYDTLTIDFESIAKLSFYGKAILDNTLAGVWRVHDGNATHKTRTAFKVNGELQLKRLEGYAKDAYGKDFEPHWKRKIRKENNILYLELLAENGFFWDLVKKIFVYREPYYRTPVMLVKSVLQNLRKKR